MRGTAKTIVMVSLVAVGCGGSSSKSVSDGGGDTTTTGAGGNDGGGAGAGGHAGTGGAGGTTTDAGAGGAGGRTTDGGGGGAAGTTTTGAGGATTTDAGGDASGAGGAGGSAGTIHGKLAVLTDCSPSPLSAKAEAIAAGTNGVFALVALSDTTATLEHYTGQGCALSKDVAYHGPTLQTSSSPQIAADSHDHVYVGTMGASSLETVEVDGTGAVVQHYQQAASTIAVTPDGLALYTAFVGTPVRATRAASTGSYAADAAFTPPALSFVGGILPLSAGGSLVGGSQEVGKPYQIFALSNSGQIMTTYGTADQTSSAFICNVQALAACGASTGFCVSDYNCHRVLVFDGAGVYEDGLDFGDARQPLSLAPAGMGRTYLLHTGATSSDPNVLSIISGAR